MKFIGGQFSFFLSAPFAKMGPQIKSFDAFYTEPVVVGLQIMGDNAAANVVGFVAIGDEVNDDE